MTHELRGEVLIAEFERGSDAISAALAFQAHAAPQNDLVRPRPLYFGLVPASLVLSSGSGDILGNIEFEEAVELTTEWSLSGPGPETYEQYQVPAIFEPLARLLLERIGLSAGQTVLDIACGTGVVARLAAPIVGNSGRVVGIDFNAGMLDVARANTPAKIVNIEWRHGDAGDLPAEDSTFDVVICQQGLQFFPDKAGALGEMRRVLKSGQSAWLAVWQSPDHSPVNQASNAVLGRYLGEQAVHISRAPFALGNPEELRALVSGAGFREIGIEAVTLIRRMPPPEISIPAQLMSLPLGPQIAALDAKIRDAIVSEIGAALTPYFTDSGMEVPQGTHIVSARK